MDILWAEPCADFKYPLGPRPLPSNHQGDELQPLSLAAGFWKVPRGGVHRLRSPSPTPPRGLLLQQGRHNQRGATEHLGEDLPGRHQQSPEGRHHSQQPKPHLALRDQRPSGPLPRAVSPLHSSCTGPLTPAPAPARLLSKPQLFSPQGRQDQRERRK